MWSFINDQINNFGDYCFYSLPKLKLLLNELIEIAEYNNKDSNNNDNTNSIFTINNSNFMQ